jgi:valyl-tRNA synthetase
MNLDGFDAAQFMDIYRDESSLIDLTLADRWILSRLQRTAAEVDQALEEFRINDAAQAIYRFIWNELCDWYIELAKPALRQSDDEAARMRRRMTQGVLAVSLETAMRLLHPFMPFVTEEIWQQLPKPSGTPGSIMITLFAQPEERYLDPAAERDMELVKGVVSAVRMIRSEYNVPPRARLSVTLLAGSDGSAGAFDEHGHYVRGLAGIDDLLVRRDQSSRPAGIVASAQVQDTEVIVPLGDVIDVAAERARIAKEARKAEGEIGGLEKKLSNQSFLERAPADVIDDNKMRLTDARERLARLTGALARLEAAS